MTRSARYSYAEWERVRDEGIPVSYALACAIYIPAFLIASMVAEIVVGVTDAPSSSWSLELHILELSGAPAVAAVAIVWVQNRTRLKLPDRAAVSLVLAVCACALAGVVVVILYSRPAERCVDVKTMTVAARKDCQNQPRGAAGRPGGTGTEDRYAWYYGGSGTDEEGEPAKGGSFTAPGEGGGGTSDDGEGGEGGE
jgi:hypothetical protein